MSYYGNLDYDTGAIKHDTNASMKPLEFILDPTSVENVNQVYPDAPGFLGNDLGGVQYSDPNDRIHTRLSMIDLESDLSGRTRKLTKNPEKQYHPQCIDPKSLGIPSGDYCDAEIGIPVKDAHRYTSYPRLINPPKTLLYSGVGVNRFEFPLMNPQDVKRWESADYIGSNSRYIAKDDFMQKKNKMTYTREDYQSDPDGTETHMYAPF